MFPLPLKSVFHSQMRKFESPRVTWFGFVVQNAELWVPVRWTNGTVVCREMTERDWNRIMKILDRFDIRIL